jgi:hypothetical protein
MKYVAKLAGALGSSALAISEIFGDLVSFHRKERLLASWQKNGFRSTRTTISRSTSWLSGGGAPFVAGGSPTAAGCSSNCRRQVRAPTESQREKVPAGGASG